MAGGDRARRANAEQKERERGTERRRGGGERQRIQMCIYPKKFTRGQARTLAALRLSTVFSKGSKQANRRDAANFALGKKKKKTPRRFDTRAHHAARCVEMTAMRQKSESSLSFPSLTIRPFDRRVKDYLGFGGDLYSSSCNWASFTYGLET